MPSRFNNDHLHFFLIEDEELPDTIGMIPLITKTLINYKIIYAKKCDENYISISPDTHSSGEYSIEVVIQKRTI